MPFSRTLSVVGCHAEGEVGDVITGGVLDVPGSTMYDKLVHFLNEKDDIRQLLLNEPRGRCSMNTNLILPPCDPRADAGFLIMESEEYAPMSGSNTICTTTVLLETGMVPMKEPITELTLDTAAGLVTVKAECEAGKCKNVAFDNVPAFVFKLDYQVLVPGLGEVSVDIAWGGMMYVLVDAASVGLKIESRYSTQLVEIGERIKRAVQASYTPVHPENPRIKGVSILGFTEPLTQEDGYKAATNTVVVSPGRFDRSPCGTGTCARLAVLHSRGQLAEGEIFKHRSIIGTEFTSHIRGITQVGGYQAVLPTVAGRAWITSFKQIVLDSSDPFPKGFRVGDQWPMTPGSLPQS
ncbi:Proline racemase [Penicillium cf. griseofulvum]|uniref:Proline racemase n=1 Tax=Penicillium cf. griseofulvum TaxID=2972120 RepID=A0A9W9IZM7_9EURO|nr:Proline racemase [Penicillium cf. griseofulvum]KAJ5435886.1 Proline racemase [Penicillium cf. griseofulvum]